MTPQQISQPHNWGFVQAYRRGVAAQGSSSPTASTIATSFTTDHNYPGTHLVGTGEILSLPKRSNHVQLLDPATDAISGFNIQSVGAAANGRVYGIQRSRNQVLVIDPSTDTTWTVNIAPSGADYYFSAALAPQWEDLRHRARGPFRPGHRPWQQLQQYGRSASLLSAYVN